MHFIFTSGLPMPGKSDWSWYLPPSLQLWEVYMAIAVSFAAVAWGRSFPGNWGAQRTVHGYAFLASLVVLAPTLGVQYWQYSFGTALIAAAISTFAYPIVLSVVTPLLNSWLTARIKLIFGISPPVAEPVTPDPQSLPPKNP